MYTAQKKNRNPTLPLRSNDLVGQQSKELQKDGGAGSRQLNRVTAHWTCCLVLNPAVDASLVETVTAFHLTNRRRTQWIKAYGTRVGSFRRLTRKRDLHVYLRFQPEHEENMSNQLSPKQIAFVRQLLPQGFDLHT